MRSWYPGIPISRSAVVRGCFVLISNTGRRHEGTDINRFTLETYSPVPSLLMADLTILHAPSSLSLPETQETGLRFAFNRRSLPPRPLFSTTPMVTVQMVDTGSAPPSPVVVRDHNLLSPPRRSFKSKDSVRVTRPRPSSAPPERLGKTRTIDPRDRSSPRPKSPDLVFGRHSPIPVVVRPPTTLCACIVS
jgi:hypothetical protein